MPLSKNISKKSKTSKENDSHNIPLKSVLNNMEKSMFKNSDIGECFKFYPTRNLILENGLKEIERRIKKMSNKTDMKDKLEDLLDWVHDGLQNIEKERIYTDKTKILFSKPRDLSKILYFYQKDQITAETDGFRIISLSLGDKNGIKQMGYDIISLTNYIQHQLKTDNPKVTNPAYYVYPKKTRQYFSELDLEYIYEWRDAYNELKSQLSIQPDRFNFPSSPEVVHVYSQLITPNDIKTILDPLKNADSKSNIFYKLVTRFNKALVTPYLGVFIQIAMQIIKMMIYVMVANYFMGAGGISIMSKKIFWSLTRGYILNIIIAIFKIVPVPDSKFFDAANQYLPSYLNDNLISIWNFISSIITHISQSITDISSINDVYNKISDQILKSSHMETMWTQLYDGFSINLVNAANISTLTDICVYLASNYVCILFKGRNRLLCEKTVKVLRITFQWAKFIFSAICDIYVSWVFYQYGDKEFLTALNTNIGRYSFFSNIFMLDAISVRPATERKEIYETIQGDQKASDLYNEEFTERKTYHENNKDSVVFNPSHFTKRDEQTFLGKQRYVTNSDLKS